MTQHRRSLTVWAGQAPDSDPVRLTLADLLYSPPNPDMTRKRCGNCALWLGERGDGTRGKEECFIHAEDVVVLENMVCGYHVFGRPMGGDVPARENMQPVDPELSGLCQPAEGSSCELCAHWRGTGGRAGTCAAAYEDDVDDLGEPIHATVEANGCCAAWSEADEGVDEGA